MKSLDTYRKDKGKESAKKLKGHLKESWAGQREREAKLFESHAGRGEKWLGTQPHSIIRQLIERN